MHALGIWFFLTLVFTAPWIYRWLKELERQKSIRSLMRYHAADPMAYSDKYPQNSSPAPITAKAVNTHCLNKASNASVGCGKPRTRSARPCE